MTSLKLVYRIRPIFVATLFAVIWHVTPLIRIPSFLLERSNSTNYDALFFSGLLVALFLFRSRVRAYSWLKTVGGAALMGYFISLLCAAEVYLEKGEAIDRAVRKTNIGDWPFVIVLSLVTSILLGGWATAALAASVLKFWDQIDDGK